MWLPVVHTPNTRQYNCQNCSCGTRALQEMTRYGAWRVVHEPRVLLLNDQLYPYRYWLNAHPFPDDRPLHLLCKYEVHIVWSSGNLRHLTMTCNSKTSSVRILEMYFLRMGSFTQYFKHDDFKDAWVCGRLLAGIVGSNPAGDVIVCLLWVCVLLVEISATSRSLVRISRTQCVCVCVCLCVCVYVSECGEW